MLFYTEIGCKEIERFDSPKDKDYIDIFLLIYHSISKYKHGWYRSFVPSGIICFSVDRYIRVRMNLFCNRVYLGSIDVLSSRVCDIHCLFIMVINPCTTQVTPTTTTKLNEIRPYSQSRFFYIVNDASYLPANAAVIHKTTVNVCTTILHMNIQVGLGWVWVL